MNEVSFLFSLKTKFIKEGFEYIKFADKSTQGIPDSFIAKDGKGCFIEAKLLHLATPPTEFRNWSSIKGKKSIQFIRMIRLSAAFKAFYVIGFRIADKDTRVAVFSPMELFVAIRREEAAPIETLYTVDGAIERIKELMQ